MSRMHNCYFCGSDRVDLYSKTYPHPPFKLSYIECHNCGAVITFQHNERPEQTLAMWNGGNTTDLEELKTRELAMKRWARSGSTGRLK